MSDYQYKEYINQGDATVGFIDHTIPQYIIDEIKAEARTNTIDEVLRLPMHFFAIDGEIYIKARDIEQLKERKE